MNWFDNANLRASTVYRGMACLGLLMLNRPGHPGRRVNTVGVLVLAVLMFYCFSPVLRAGETVQPVVKAAFGADCETMVIRELAVARKEVTVAIYSLTRRKINSAFVKAARRGVQVTIKYDAGQEELQAMKESIDYLKEHGVQCIPVKMTGDYAAMHHKFIVIDRQLVLTGSYNYTVPATTINYENMVSISSPEIAGAFVKEFEKIKDR